MRLPIWDIPTRLFHWSLVGSVGFCALSGFACAVFVGLSPALGLLGAIAGALVGWRWSVKG